MITCGRQFDYSKIPTEEWSKYPDIKPKERGYYLTTYLDIEKGQLYYKCLYWDSDNQKWIWPPKPIEVGCFVEKTKSKYYTECLGNLKNLIDKWTAEKLSKKWSFLLEAPNNDCRAMLIEPMENMNDN